VEAELGDAIKDYNRTMAERMGWSNVNPYEYHPERGLYYHHITPDMICGSQPRSQADIDHLVSEEGVGAVLNLQQDRDLQHWGVDVRALSARCAHHGVPLLRTPAVDFDPHSLRATLPSAVAALERARRDHGRVYVHCTAGLGRSPAVVIASLYWFHGIELDDAYAALTAIRPCGPNKEAIRGATYDLLSGRHWDGFQHEAAHGFATLGDHDRARIRAALLG
jgi:protein-tyrosine phosphatase